jgi:hypothetical protein
MLSSHGCMEDGLTHLRLLEVEMKYKKIGMSHRTLLTRVLYEGTSEIRDEGSR